MQRFTLVLLLSFMCLISGCTSSAQEGLEHFHESILSNDTTLYTLKDEPLIFATSDNFHITHPPPKIDEAADTLTDNLSFYYRERLARALTQQDAIITDTPDTATYLITTNVKKLGTDRSPNSAATLLGLSYMRDNERIAYFESEKFAQDELDNRTSEELLLQLVDESITEMLSGINYKKAK